MKFTLLLVLVGATSAITMTGGCKDGDNSQATCGGIAGCTWVQGRGSDGTCVVAGSTSAVDHPKDASLVQLGMCFVEDGACKGMNEI